MKSVTAGREEYAAADRMDAGEAEMWLIQAISGTWSRIWSSLAVRIMARPRSVYVTRRPYLSPMKD
jgi:hypothetical protein